MIPFIVTIDTEGDNLWSWKPGKEIHTENALYIPRFQELCERYDIKPVYLVNYEMAMDARFISYIKMKADAGTCEIGMHCHAWNTPPLYELKNNFCGNPYITEYPEDVMFEKMKFMTDLLQDKFNRKMVSHRAGRWASNNTMFQILSELGYSADCSWVSKMNLSALPGASVSTGFNYQEVENRVYQIKDGLFEIPMSAMHMHHFEGKSIRNVAKNMLIGQDVWLRPATTTSNLMIRIIDKMLKDKVNYIEFMIHSSELMPGGSPYCKTDEQVEIFYKRIENVFKYITDKCDGLTLANYVTILKADRN